MKITEARLRQIIREEIKERRKYMSAASHPAFLAGHNEAMKGTPAVDAIAKMPYDEETEEADLFMQGFEQGEHDFGYRMEGEEGDDALDEMYGGYGRSGSRGGYKGSAYSGFPPAQARALAKQLAPMGRNRRLHSGDQRALDNWVGQQAFSTSREAKAAIIKYLVGKRFGNPVDYR